MAGTVLLVRPRVLDRVSEAWQRALRRLRDFSPQACRPHARPRHLFFRSYPFMLGEVCPACLPAHGSAAPLTDPSRPVCEPTRQLARASQLACRQTGPGDKPASYAGGRQAGRPGSHAARQPGTLAARQRDSETAITTARLLGCQAASQLDLVAGMSASCGGSSATQMSMW